MSQEVLLGNSWFEQSSLNFLDRIALSVRKHAIPSYVFAYLFISYIDVLLSLAVSAIESTIYT